MFKRNSSISLIEDGLLDEKIDLKILPSIDNYLLKFDGCSKGNPGLSGCGIAIYKNDIEIFADSKYLGDNKTNNQAEYCGLILGLKCCSNLNIKKLKVEGDSLLVISQMNKKYKVNSPLLLPLYEIANKLVSNFDKVEFSHIYRTNNKRADALSNSALNNLSIINDTDEE
jgi:ribonuclease HI